MSPEARRYLEAARVPATLDPQEFGLWAISRHHARNPAEAKLMGWPSQTILSRLTKTGPDQINDNVVMVDNVDELQRHLPVWRAAHGRVLVTGLGLGCVVRGLLTKPAVEHIDVIEIDPQIAGIVGPTVADRRVTIHVADALLFPIQPGTKWDIAWHDLHDLQDDRGVPDGKNRLQFMHAGLMTRFLHAAGRQGAWGFPREFKTRVRRAGLRLIG